MMVNGFSPGTPVPEQRPTHIEKEKVREEIKQTEQILVSEVQKDVEKEKNAERDSKYEQNEHQLKELLFLMTSRGNSATVEKLAKLLKKEREILSKH